MLIFWLIDVPLRCAVMSQSVSLSGGLASSPVGKILLCGSAIHLRSGSHAACKWTRYGPFRGSVPKAAILCGGFAVWVIYVVT